MTEKEIAQYCEKSLHQIWLEMAMRHFYEEEPEQGFAVAEIFVKELLRQEPRF